MFSCRSPWPRPGIAAAHGLVFALYVFVNDAADVGPGAASFGAEAVSRHWPERGVAANTIGTERAAGFIAPPYRDDRHRHHFAIGQFVDMKLPAWDHSSSDER
jgi:hypothetical protein